MVYTGKAKMIDNIAAKNVLLKKIEQHAELVKSKAEDPNFWKWWQLENEIVILSRAQYDALVSGKENAEEALAAKLEEINNEVSGDKEVSASIRDKDDDRDKDEGDSGLLTSGSKYTFMNYTTTGSYMNYTGPGLMPIVELPEGAPEHLKRGKMAQRYGGIGSPTPSPITKRSCMGMVITKKSCITNEEQVQVQVPSSCMVKTTEEKEFHGAAPAKSAYPTGFGEEDCKTDRNVEEKCCQTSPQPSQLKAEPDSPLASMAAL